MNDIEFNKLWSALNVLEGIGCYVAIFKLSEEDKIRKGISERYGDRYGVRENDELFLRNIKILFI